MKNREELSMPTVDPEYKEHAPEDVLIHIGHYPKGAMVFWCPGCKAVHRVNVPGFEGKGHIWGYNGDPVKPTLSPSILQYESPGYSPRCHSFVKAGKIQFLSDCGHELAGQTIDLIPYDEAGDD